MILSIYLKEQHFTFDTSKVKDISIPLKFNGEQPNIYNTKRAESRAYEADGFIGDTRQGGGCNFEQLTLVPHCNGTHTECIGHITHKRFSIQEQLKDALIPATVLTVSPENAMTSTDTYHPEKEKDDVFISAGSLKNGLDNIPKEFLKALVIRTIPNDAAKMKRNYMQKQPAFFSIEAMNYIVKTGVEHLLVDVPSLDRAYDEGKLNAHHLFWNMEAGSHKEGPNSMVNKTITEMIYVRDEVADGLYLLNLQIAPFVSDAAPSRPLLYPLIKALKADKH